MKFDLTAASHKGQISSPLSISSIICQPLFPFVVCVKVKFVTIFFPTSFQNQRRLWNLCKNQSLI